jgi:hypothetical protein
VLEGCSEIEDAVSAKEDYRLAQPDYQAGAQLNSLEFMQYVCSVSFEVMTFSIMLRRSE